MPLMLLDLDNTLIDRDTAFREAAGEFLGTYGLPAADLAWVTALDGGGYTPRADVAAGLLGRYGALVPDAAVRGFLDEGAAGRVVLAPAVHDALAGARAAGWVCVVVTNGRAVQQEAKIRRTGLDGLVHAWVVSESVGHKKPAPEIFRAAAGAVGLPLGGAWMIGDSAHADIAGAYALGLRSVWVAAGRSWDEDGFRPTHIAEDVTSAIAHAVADPA